MQLHLFDLMDLRGLSENSLACLNMQNYSCFKGFFFLLNRNFKNGKNIMRDWNTKSHCKQIDIKTQWNHTSYKQEGAQKKMKKKYCMIIYTLQASKKKKKKTLWRWVKEWKILNIDFYTFCVLCIHLAATVYQYGFLFFSLEENGTKKR